MNFPFVSRGTLEALVASERARALAAEAAVVAVEARYDRLLDTLLAEKAPKQPLPAQAGDPLQALIRVRAGNNGTVRRALGQFVMQQRAIETPEEDIVKGLTHWHSSDDEGIDG